MQRWQRLVTLGVGLVLLSLLILPKLSPSELSDPISLRFLRYQTNASDGVIAALLEVRNHTTHSSFYSISQSEFLGTNHLWLPCSVETNHPIALLRPKAVRQTAITPPIEAKNFEWRLTLFGSTTSGRFERQIDRLLLLLKLKQRNRTSPTVLLYSDVIPPLSTGADARP